MSMSASGSLYRTDLEWQDNLSSFTEPERKVLLALSSSRYRWRTIERLVELTGLPPKEIDSILEVLIAKKYVRLSSSKNKNIIFGLREVVG